MIRDPETQVLSPKPACNMFLSILGSFRPNSIGCQGSSWSTQKVCQASFGEYIHLAKHQASLPSPSEKTLDPVISKEPSGEQKPFQPHVVRLSASNHWLLKLPWHTKFKSTSIMYICDVWNGKNESSMQKRNALPFSVELVWTEASKKMLSKNPRRFKFVPLQLDRVFFVQATTYKPQALCLKLSIFKPFGGIFV